MVDLVFVMDGSGSIEHFGSGNFNRCKKFAKDMVNNFEVSNSGTHVGLLLFSSSASVIFALDKYYDIASIEKAIDGIEYPEGGTYIGNALSMTKSGIIDVSARSNVHRIIIVMTDGASSDDVTGPSNALKEAGNSLYVLGIGTSTDISELNKIASDPEQDYVFHSGFDELDKAVKSIKEKACTGEQLVESSRMELVLIFPGHLTLREHWARWGQSRRPISIVPAPNTSAL